MAAMTAVDFQAIMAQAAQTAQQNMQQMQQAMQQQHAAQLAQLALLQAPPAAPAAPRGPRFAAPTAFDGRSATLDAWKADMLRQFEWYNTPGDADRIRVAAAHLQGPAGDWWTSLQARPTTWPLLLAALEARFQPVNSAEIARTKLYALSQGKLTTNEYIDQFRRLLARIPDMGAPDQFHQFRRGLRPAIVAQLDVQNPPITALDAAINLAVRVGSRADMAASSNSSSSGGSSNTHHAPMELDNIEGLEHDTTDDAADAPITRAEMKLMLAAMQDTRRRGAGAGSGNGRSSSSNGSGRNGRPLPRMPHLTEDQVKEYMAAGKCFGCGSKDHTSRDCPKRKKGADGRVSWSN